MRFSRLRPAGFALAVAAAAVVSLATATPAAAAFTLCNKTSYMLASAIGYRVKGRWFTRGWFTVEPGQCTPVLDFSLPEGAYYTHAFSLPFHSGAPKTFGGSQQFCTDPGLADFTIAGQDDCERRGFAERGFARVDVHGRTDWTTTYTERANYTMETARIAGVQRLLSDAGLSYAPIDGVMNEETRKAIIAFKRGHKMPADTTTPSLLFQSLATDAAAKQDATGYHFCNETPAPVWAALAYSEGETFVATGWFRIAPHACLQAIKDQLNAKRYFSYAETDKTAAKSLVWGGDHEFCVLKTRFTIRGRNCAQRGLTGLGFREIPTDNATGYTQTLTADTASADRVTAR